MSIRDYLKNKGYQLLREIGKGSFATVYKARKIQDQIDIAIKVIPLSRLSPAKLRNCLDEVRIICRLNHPFIVKHFDSFYSISSKLLFIVTEYLPGGDLGRHIQRLKDSNKRLSETQIWRIILQTFNGLAHLHDLNVLHRDIKPANLFFSKDMKTIKIGDLNTCRIIMKGNLTRSLIGTPNYLAPEVWEKIGYDQRCDVFSLGCVIYEITALSRTFPGKSMDTISRKIRKGIYNPVGSTYSKELGILISCCLIHNYKKRPSIEDLLKTKVIREKLKLFPEIKIQKKGGSINWGKSRIPSDFKDFEKIFESIQNRAYSRSKSEIFEKRKKQNLFQNQNQKTIYRKSSTLGNIVSKKLNQNIRKVSIEKNKPINIYDDDDNESFYINNTKTSYNVKKSNKYQQDKKIESEIMKIIINPEQTNNKSNPLNMAWSKNNQNKSRKNLFNNMFKPRNPNNLNIKSQGKMSETTYSMGSNNKSIKSFGYLKSSNSPDKAVIYYNMYQESLLKSKSISQKSHAQSSISRSREKKSEISNNSNYVFNKTSSEIKKPQKRMISRHKKRKLEQKKLEQRKSRNKKLPLPFINIFDKSSEGTKKNSNQMSSITKLKLKNEFSLPSPSEKSQQSRSQTNKLFVNQYFDNNTNLIKNKSKVF